MDKITNYSELVALYGVRDMAIDLFGANEKGNPHRKDYDRVYKWYINNVIPMSNWKTLVKTKKSRQLRITLRKLIELDG